MKNLKKYWYIISLLVITLGLGIVTYLTSQKLTETQPVAPNVPQEKPQAVTPACTLQFSISLPTHTPTGTITITDTPTNTPVSTNTPTNTPVSTNTPTNTPVSTNTPTNTPIPPAECDAACTTDTDCGSNLVCSSGGLCRNASCIDRTNCICAVAPTEAPLPQTPVAGSPALFGLSAAAVGILLLFLGLVF